MDYILEGFLNARLDAGDVLQLSGQGKRELFCISVDRQFVDIVLPCILLTLWPSLRQDAQVQFGHDDPRTWVVQDSADQTVGDRSG